MLDAAGAAQPQQLFAQRDHVVGQPRGPVGGDEAAHQPLVLGRQSGRAVARAAALRLYAADGQHRFAAALTMSTPSAKARSAASVEPSLPAPNQTTF